ncbi:MAG TPA: hypothetical protein VF126_10515 [Acidobacteriaceae bacterium]
MADTMRIQALIVTVLLCALRTFPAMGQNHFSFVSDFVKAGRPAPAQCVTEGVQFMKLLSAYPHPASGWTFVVVCDDTTWHHVMRNAGMAEGPGERYGETDIEHNLTLIRGAKLIHADMGVTPEHIVAHELAHVMLRSTDEAKVDRQAFTWMAERRDGRQKSVIESSPSSRALNSKHSEPLGTTALLKPLDQNSAHSVE